METKRLLGITGLAVIILFLAMVFIAIHGLTRERKPARAQASSVSSSTKNGISFKGKMIPLSAPASKNVGIVPCSITGQEFNSKPAFSAPKAKSVKAVAEKIKKKIRIFPAEKKFLEFFNSSEGVDSSTWKPSYGWPTSRQIKWLAVNCWGDFIGSCCDFLKMKECTDIIISIFCHESSASPFAINHSSGALGPGQTVFTTGKNLSRDKRIQVPPEYIDRTCPEQTSLMIAVLFKTNMGFFKAKGYKNYRDWAILAHYTGALNAEDTANYYGGLYETPFYKSIVAFMKTKPAVAPEWAQGLWRGQEWATIERIRQQAMGRPKSAKKQNLVRSRQQAIPLQQAAVVEE